MNKKDSPGGKDNPGHPEKEFDEYELYYGENAVIEPEINQVKLPGPLSRRPSLSSAVPFLVLSILFFLCTFMFNRGIYSDHLWASRETVFFKHEYWRLLTAIFTHSDIVHLLSNIPLFFFFGLFLYEYFGFMLFPVLSLLTGIAANTVTLYFYPDTVRLVGASGMVYGMVPLWLVLYIYHDTDHTVPLRIFRSIAFALIMMFPSTYDPDTSYMAHAAGFVIGILCAVAVLPFARVKIKSD